MSRKLFMTPVSWRHSLTGAVVFYVEGRTTRTSLPVKSSSVKIAS